MQSKSTQFKNILALMLFGLVFSTVSQRAEAQYNFSLLHSFNNTDGASPQDVVTFDSQGNLYGTTSNGGAYDAGTVFKIDSQGNFSLLHSFNYNDPTDGAFPQASVTVDSQGNLYGTTELGGANDVANGGDGTVWKMDPNGHHFSLLHSFNFSDVNEPFASVTLDRQGNLYGTTELGGSYDHGTVYKIDTQGNFSLLHSFNINDSSDGSYPLASVTLDSQGNLYGTTSGGGGYGYGTVFKMDSNGNNFILLHSFTFPYGAYPQASVTLDSQGNLYGTTSQGSGYGYGTVFKMDTNGNNFILLHSFNIYNRSDGATPTSSVTLDSQGNLYGTTELGGANGGGTVFKIVTLGNFSLLHSFNSSIRTDGWYPYGVALDSQGNLYGTTLYGGAYANGNNFGYGTVFELANNITTPTVSFTYHGFVHRPGSHTISQQITITNTSGAALTGPFNLVVSGLPSNITLIHATGATAFNYPGSPYITLGSSSLAPGASITVILSFNDPSLRYISYTPTFLVGNGTP